MYRLENTDALIVVDPQIDFMPGGALAVDDGLRVFAPINRVAPHFEHVFATRDWHPKNHNSFAAQGGPWPVHCVAESRGAEFHPLLQVDHIDHVVNTGVTPEAPGYSGFEGTDLDERLHDAGAKRIFVCGVATDYCVKETVLSALRRGFQTFFLTDAIAAVDAAPGDGTRAIEEMQRRGATAITSNEIDVTGSAT